jgi:hypothetical protein
MGSREQGAGSREQGAGSGEQGAVSGEQGAVGNRDERQGNYAINNGFLVYCSGGQCTGAMMRAGNWFPARCSPLPYLILTTSTRLMDFPRKRSAKIWNR